MDAFMEHYYTWQRQRQWTPAKMISEQYLKDNSDKFAVLFHGAKESGDTAQLLTVASHWLTILES